MPEQHPLPDPNTTELGILQHLWRHGRLSARELHEHVSRRNGWAYSTTRTTLERMVGKGLLDKAPFHGLHLYASAVARPAVLAGKVREFAERVLESDWGPVVALFAQAETLPPEEIDELRRLLEGQAPQQTHRE